MAEVSTEALQDAIRNLHGCESRHVESVAITEQFNGVTVWDGDVQVFDLMDCPEADRAYAWSYPTEGERRRFVVVLHKPPVDSPHKAVQAAIASEYRGTQNDRP
jgi:hypothetical protein